MRKSNRQVVEAGGMLVCEHGLTCKQDGFHIPNAKLGKHIIEQARQDDDIKTANEINALLSVRTSVNNRLKELGFNE